MSWWNKAFNKAGGLAKVGSNGKLPDEIVNLPEAVPNEFTWIVKSTDESKSSVATPQSDSELFFTAEANKTYLIMLGIRFHGNGNNGGFRHHLQIPSNPAGLNNDMLYIEFRDRSTDAFLIVDANGSSLGTVLSNNNIPSNADWQLMFRPFLITIGASGGVVRYRWGQNLSNATPTVVRKGSLLAYRKLN